MTRLTYATSAGGGWIAVASGTQLVVLHPDASDRVPELWEAVHGPGPLSAVIRILARDGLSALPEFAIVDASGDRLRVIVRGGVSLEVDDAHGVHRQDGTDVSTWTERTFEAATAVRVSVTHAERADPQLELPLISGVAVVSSCAVTLGTADSDAPDHEEQPTDAAIIEETLLAAAIEDRAADTRVVSVSVSETTVSDPADPGDDSDDDMLSGDTVFVPRRRPGAPAAPQTPPAAPPVEQQPDPLTAAAIAGDHDGMTILSSDLPKGRAKAAIPPPAPSPPPVVLVGADEVRHPLDQPIIVGRAPSATQVSGGRLPQLITVGGSDPDISRTHARFALEGDSVVVTDLHSRNGTLVVLPGKSPQKLRAGEPTTVIVGTVVDLGGGITFRVDG